MQWLLVQANLAYILHYGVGFVDPYCSDYGEFTLRNCVTQHPQRGRWCSGPPVRRNQRPECYISGRQSRRLLCHCHRLGRADAPFHRFLRPGGRRKVLVFIGLAATASLFCSRLLAYTLYIGIGMDLAH